MHGFSDASVSAYAACIYVKSALQYEIVAVIFVDAISYLIEMKQVAYDTEVRPVSKIYFTESYRIV